MNLLLCIVTLGFYLPFAKARRLAYFHGNTQIGGQALGFHGNPWKMLRGHVLMLGLAICGVASAAGAAAGDGGVPQLGIGSGVTVGIFSGAVVFYLAMLAVSLPYWSSRLQNLVWGHTSAAERSIGDEALAAFDQQLAPSKWPVAQQRALQQSFDELLVRAYPAERRPACTLHFRGVGRSGIGANAFALPGGPVVLTDPLAALFFDWPEVLLGALAHEAGHVQHRHGLRMVVQASLWGVIAASLVGDVSTLLAVVPVVLAQQAYSRDAEREADAEARHGLLAMGIPPSVMVTLFDRLAARQPAEQDWRLPIALASHPDDAERRRFFGAE